MLINDSLSVLVSSLTKSEKKYVNIDLSSNVRNGKSNLLNVYKKIELITGKNQAVSNSELSEICGVKHINSTKKQLKDAILRSLRSYNNNKKARWIIENHKKNGEIYLSKRLPKDALKEFSKALILAEKHENHLLICQLEILKLECRKLIFDPKQLEGQIEDCFVRIGRVQNDLSEFLKRKRGYEIVRADLKIRGISRSDMDKNNRAVKFKMLSNSFYDSNQRSSKFMDEGMKGIHYFSVGQFEKSFQSSKKSLTILEQNTHEVTEYGSQYLICLYNLIVGAYYTDRSEDVEKYLSELKSYEVSEFSDYLFKIERFYNIAFNLYMSDFNLGMLHKLVYDFQNIFQTVGNHLDKEFKILLFGQCANIFLFLKDHKACKKWNNFLLKSSHSSIRGDILATAMMRDLIITWDQDRYDLLIYKLKNVEQRLKSKNKLHSAELLIIKKMYQAVDNNFEDPSMYMYQAVKSIFKNKENRRVLDQFDYVKYFELALKN